MSKSWTPCWGSPLASEILSVDLVLLKSLGPRGGLGALNWGTQGRVSERQTWQDDLACFSSLGMGKVPCTSLGLNPSKQPNASFACGGQSLLPSMAPGCSPRVAFLGPPPAPAAMIGIGGLHSSLLPSQYSPAWPSIGQSGRQPGLLGPPSHSKSLFSLGS